MRPTMVSGRNLPRSNEILRRAWTISSLVTTPLPKVDSSVLMNLQVALTSCLVVGRVQKAPFLTLISRTLNR